MNFRIILLLFVLFFVGAGKAFSNDTVFVTIVPSKPVIVAKGQTAQLTIRAKIKQGFHIQANPAADEFLVSATLTIKASKGIVPGEPVYPPGIPYRLEGTKDDLLTYEDEVIIKLPVKVLDSALTGNLNLSGELKVQPCDDKRCFFPRSVPVVIPVEIVGPLK